MEIDTISCYSPFHPGSHFDVRNQSLLLQFTLMALVREVTEKKVGTTALRECLLLFPHAFLGMEDAIALLARHMKRKTRRESLSKFLPFFHVCKSDETLWLFFIQRGHHLATREKMSAFLQELYDENLALVSQRMSERFAKRGFKGAAKECLK